MRELTYGTNKHTTVVAADEPSIGGANHKYRVMMAVRCDKTKGEAGTGLCYVNFQKGPVKESGINGIHNEDLISIVMDRLDGFQNGEYACQENAAAKELLLEALDVLRIRTDRRKDAGVEGTHGKDEGLTPNLEPLLFKDSGIVQIKVLKTMPTLLVERHLRKCFKSLGLDYYDYRECHMAIPCDLHGAGDLFVFEPVPEFPPNTAGGIGQFNPNAGVGEVLKKHEDINAADGAPETDVTGNKHTDVAMPCDGNFPDVLAALCHDQWTGWVKYLFSVCETHDGTVYMPKGHESLWKRQMSLGFCDLTPEERDSDRTEARKFITLLNMSQPTLPIVPTPYEVKKEPE